MPAKDWFRNKEWNAEIEQAFFRKLGRARDKAQYLRLQAGELLETHPEVTLRLLDKYFEMKQQLFNAGAFLDQARAFRRLGRIDDAIESLQKALGREREFPNVKTQAWSDFTILVARERLEQHYDQALAILEEESRQPLPMMAVQQFLWYASHAFIDAAQGRRELAKEYAEKALRAAEVKHSGFRYHPTFGLVDSSYEPIENELKMLLADKWPPRPPSRISTYLKKLRRR